LVAPQFDTRLPESRQIGAAPARERPASRQLPEVRIGNLAGTVRTRGSRRPAPIPAKDARPRSRLSLGSG